MQILPARPCALFHTHIVCRSIYKYMCICFYDIFAYRYMLTIYVIFVYVCVFPLFFFSLKHANICLSVRLPEKEPYMSFVLLLLLLLLLMLFLLLLLLLLLPVLLL